MDSEEADSEEAWQVEIEVLKKIKEGKIEMEIVTADELIKELKELDEEET